ncbi:MAG: TetR/AcrR family transcriptional regulator [Planctomycetota bacterium]|nr:TetR/AcrR family transcriptional regulator [Planctomycetota bacterium]
MSKSIESKKRICEAAIVIAGRDGYSAMSLEAVAKQAGVSKGGLLYHFPSKDDLLQGTLQHFAKVARGMLMERIAADPTPNMRWARGFVTCMFPSEEELASSKQDLDPNTMGSFLMAMLTVAADRGSSVQPLSEFGAELRDRLLEKEEEEGLEQMILWLAIDGLMVWKLLGLITPGAELFDRLGRAFRERVGLPPEHASLHSSLGSLEEKTKKGAHRAK